MTAAALVVSMAGVAAAKPQKQSPAKYAKTVCGAYTSFTDMAKSYETALSAIDPSDPAAYTTQAVAATNTFLTAFQTSVSKLTNAYPDVSDGKKVATLLNASATTIQSSVKTAIANLQAATSPGAVAVAQFSAAVTTLFATLIANDPFSKITDQTVLGALKKEKSCKNVVQIIG
ncbi:MAG TPA: hypothetical protein VIJ44_06375 [Acidimicrobiia bacterium]